MSSAFVTGASRGIGLGIATRLAERGYALTISARGAERLESVAERLREVGAKEVRAVAADLADPEATARVVETHREAFGSMKAPISLVETLNAEESGNGISASALAPAYVDTDMSDWIEDKIPADRSRRSTGCPSDGNGSDVKSSGAT